MWARRAIVFFAVVSVGLGASSLACTVDYIIWSPSAGADPLYRFVKDDKIGYIDQTGKIVIPPTIRHFGGNYDGVFHDGLVEIGLSDGVYLDKSGKRAISRKLFRGWDFSEGLAAAMAEADSNWGYIDTKGDWAISPRFLSSPLNYVWSFAGGFAMIEVKGRYGYIDHSGQFAIEPKFLMGDSFRDGLARVVVEGPCVYSDSTSACPSVQAIPAGTKDSDKLAGCKFAFIDATGRVISEDRFEDARSFSEGLAAVQIHGKWGYTDKNAKVVIPPEYSDAGAFSEGLAPVYRNGRGGFIAKDGSIVIATKFESVSGFSEGFAVVRDEDMDYWYVDRSGNRMFAATFAAAGPFFKGLAHVKLHGTPERFAYIDRTGKHVFEYAP